MTIPNECDQFVYGGNYAWNNFGQDIGGGAAGFAANQNLICSHFQDMADHCVSLVRVWMFADLRSPAISFDGNDCVTGIGGSSQADIEALSSCAAAAGIKLMWTITAHNANDTSQEQGVNRPTIRQSIVDANCRTMFMDNLIEPVTDWIVNDPNYANTFHSYDLFNEPDWVVDDGNPIFPSEPFNGYHVNEMGAGNSVTYNEMYTFLSSMATRIRTRDSNACITIGTAAKKWVTAWQQIVDFNSPHSYFWDEAYYPSTSPPSSYGFTKPTMIGEYPSKGMLADANLIGQVAGALPRTQEQLLCQWAENNYFGALAWSYTDTGNQTNNNDPNNLEPWQGTNMDNGLAFVANELKRGRFIRPNTPQIACGTTTNVILNTVSNKGTHVPFDESSLAISAGTINSINYNSSNCTYIVNITTPDCPFDERIIITGQDQDGNPMAGEFVDTKSDDCNAIVSTCNVFFGNCNSSTDSFCTVNFDDLAGCNLADPCVVNIDCRCKPSFTKILGGDPYCPKLGEIFEWKLGGCDCIGDITSCGPPTVHVKQGSNSSPTCFFEEEQIFRIGPVTDTKSISFSVRCTKLADCVEDNGSNGGSGGSGGSGGNNTPIFKTNTPTEAPCLNASLLISNISMGEEISASDINSTALSIDSIQTFPDSSIINIVNSGNNLIFYGLKNGSTYAIIRTRDVNGNFCDCRVNLYVNDQNIVCLD